MPGPRLHFMLINHSLICSYQKTPLWIRRTMALKMVKVIPGERRPFSIRRCFEHLSKHEVVLVPASPNQRGRSATARRGSEKWEFSYSC